MKSDTKFSLSLMRRWSARVAWATAGQEEVTTVTFKAQCFPTAFKVWSIALIMPGFA